MKSARLFVAGLLAVVLPLTFVSAASGSVRHVVEPGDTLSYLAQIYVVTVGEIVELNGLPNPNLIFPGQDLLISGSGGDDAPAPGASTGETYTIQRGDTLGELAVRFDVSLADLQEYNNIEDAGFIREGQTITIPPPPGSVSGVPPLEFPAKPDDPQIELIIEEMAAAYGVDPSLVKALATVESGWRQGSSSVAGARGVMQIMPGTAAWLETDVFRYELNEDTSAYDNIKMGVKYLEVLLTETPNPRDAVAAYYQGLAPTQAGVFYPDTQDYVATIFAVKLTYWP